jgi:uncharacterized protein YndB with AHSA1/START domain
MAMIRFASEVTISRPTGEVFPYLIERDKQALWSDVPMTPLTEGPLGAGSRMRLTFGKGPLRASLTLELTAVEPGQRVAFKTVSDGGIQWTGEYRLVPTADGAGTHLAQEGTLEFRGLWRLAEPLIGSEIQRGEIAELEKLKAVLTSTPEAQR